MTVCSVRCRTSGGTLAIKSSDTGEVSIGGPRYMRAIANLADTGALEITTNTYSHLALAGFTGGVLVTLADASGTVLYISPLAQYGVDGTWVIWSQSNRWDLESYFVGPDVAAR